MVEDTLDETFLERSFSRQGTKRMGRPRDIGNAVAFLASPDAGFITGQNFPFNGGGFVQAAVATHRARSDDGADLTTSVVDARRIVRVVRAPPPAERRRHARQDRS
jgi:hypothetical protein